VKRKELLISTGRLKLGPPVTSGDGGHIHVINWFSHFHLRVKSIITSHGGDVPRVDLLDCRPGPVEIYSKVTNRNR